MSTPGHTILRNTARLGLAPFAPSKNICAHSLCPSPAWWLWRGVHTRSHLELGRKSPQRQWYFVSRRGRVGRCQACKEQTQKSLHSQQQNQNPAMQKCLAGSCVQNPQPRNLCRGPDLGSSAHCEIADQGKRNGERERHKPKCGANPQA